MWKATEFRQFLLYTGPIVLRKVISEKHYVNFLSLNCGVSFMMNAALATQHSLLTSYWFFMQNSVELYGRNFVTYIVHALTHLCEVVERYGSLEHCSAYPFENYMHTFKSFVRSTKNPLVQLVRRLEEAQRVNCVKDKLPADDSTLDLSVSPPNNCSQIDDGYYCLCHEVISEKQKVLCEVFDS